MMRIFITSIPAELESQQAAAVEVVRDLGFEPIVRDPTLGRGLDPVTACRHQIASVDAVLVILGWRRGRVPPPELGGDGLRPWSWWQVQAAKQHDKPLAVLMATPSWQPEHRETDPRGRSLMEDFRGELARLAVSFDDPIEHELDSFRQQVRSQLLDVLHEDSRLDRDGPIDPGEAAAVRLRQWPVPSYPERPYPLLLPYRHPELLAGRDRELSDLQAQLAAPIPILGFYAPSGAGKSSVLAGGLVPRLRADGWPVAYDRHLVDPGLGERLIGDLLDGIDESDRFEANTEASATAVARRFVDDLVLARRSAGDRPPILILDQFEDLFRSETPPHRRAVVGRLLAASVQHLAGAHDPPCRWLLAYRQESHGQVVRWLGDVRREERRDDGPVDQPTLALPHDLSRAERFQSWPLRPLAYVESSSDEPLSAATDGFRQVIERPLAVRDADGRRRYPWRFRSADDVERLATAFGEARLARPAAPLVPELQVVLARLLEQARPEGEMQVIEVPETPAELIDQALEKHLGRALEIAFPGRSATVRAARSRALLVLRELADVEGRRQAGLPADVLARALGDRGGRGVLDRLSAVGVRLVLAERRGGHWIYTLAHDRLAQVVTRWVDRGEVGDLGLDAELIELRRFVRLRSELFATGGGDHGFTVSREQARRIEEHADALLWSEAERRWWRACRRHLAATRRRRRLRWGAAVATVALVALGTWWWAARIAERRLVLDRIERDEPESVFAALAELTEGERFDAAELSAALRRREAPWDVVERGLGGIEAAGRGAAVLRVSELYLPLLDEAPGEPRLIGSLIWALDFFVASDPRHRAAATARRDRILEPLRRRRPPPPPPADDDPRWVTIPAGTYTMGSAPGEGRDAANMLDEQPQHAVTLSAFRVMTHEVTTGEYRRLVPTHSGASPDGGPDAPDERPVNRITWFEAYTYAAWLGGRLPTESEWEYMARGPCGSMFCRADGSPATLVDVAWWVGWPMDVDAEILPRPGGLLEPSPWGLYDIFGNVWEWTANWYGPYPQTPQIDPPGPTWSEASHRTFRGGSIFETARWVAPSGRGSDTAHGPSGGLGMRVLRPVDELGGQR